MERNNKIILQEETLFGTDDSLQNIEEGTEEPNEGIVPVVDEQLQTVQKESEVITVHGGKTTFDGKIKFSPKVSVALADNMSAPKIPFPELQALYNSSDKITAEDGKTEPDLKHHVLQLATNVQEEGIQNQQFKPVRLTNQEQKLCYALSYLMTKEAESPQLKLAIDETESGSKDPLFFRITISANELCKVMLGTSRTREKAWLKELLNNFTQKFHVYKATVTNNGTTEVLRFTFPLAINRGFIEREITGKDGNQVTEFLGMNAELLRPFFDNIRKKYVPINPQIFRIWKDSSLFSNLFSELCKLWYYAMIGYNKATSEVLQKHKNIKNADKVSEVEEEIHKRQYESITRKLTFDTIINLTEEDYYSTKVKRQRFRKDVEKYLNLFVDYGIITSGKIIPDKKVIVVVFNPNFKGTNDGKAIEDHGNNIK